MSVLELLYISCKADIRARSDLVGKLESLLTSVHGTTSALVVQLSSSSDRRITSNLVTSTDRQNFGDLPGYPCASTGINRLLSSLHLRSKLTACSDVSGGRAGRAGIQCG